MPVARLPATTVRRQDYYTVSRTMGPTTISSGWWRRTPARASAPGGHGAQSPRASSEHAAFQAALADTRSPFRDGIAFLQTNSARDRGGQGLAPVTRPGRIVLLRVSGTGCRTSTTNPPAFGKKREGRHLLAARDGFRRLRSGCDSVPGRGGDCLKDCPAPLVSCASTRAHRGVAPQVKQTGGVHGG